jgi:release factor glutamine methyltransferase
MIYEPREDSFLLQRQVKKFAKGIVLDMGTGSGIQAKTASFKAKQVVALDLDKDTIKHCKKTYVSEKNIHFFNSDLFEIFHDHFFFYEDGKLEVYEKRRVEDSEKRKEFVEKQIKFDLIIFNPPYLPQTGRKLDIISEGGEKGYEILEKFFDKVPIFLKEDGTVLIVFSSLTNRKKVNEIIEKNGFTFEQLDKKSLFFEELYVYSVFRE